MASEPTQTTEAPEVTLKRAECGRPDCGAYAVTSSGKFHRVLCVTKGCGLQVVSATPLTTRFTQDYFRSVAVLSPHSVECAHLNDAADEIERLRGLIRAILAADERGQGVNYSKAMNAAAKAINYVS